MSEFGPSAAAQEAAAKHEAQKARQERVNKEFDRIMVEATTSGRDISTEQAMKEAEFNVSSREEAEDILAGMGGQGKIAA